MNLITDLESDLATAFIIEKKHSQKLDMRAAVSLIDRVTAELQNSKRDDKTGSANPKDDIYETASAH